MALSYKFGPFHLDATSGVLFRDDEPVALGPRAISVLHALVEGGGTFISKDALMEAGWSGVTVDESNLTVQIGALRRVLKEARDCEHRIDTLQRRGYRFVGPVAKEENGGVAEPGIGPGLALPDRPSIAVLPFANMSGDAEQDYFADGMAEEIITALSRCSWLFVIARNSSFTYKGRAVDVRQVGRELGVRYVLEGSVRRGGDRIRFTGQLIDATTGGHIWADRFEGDVGNMFDLQDQFTESVVAAIEPRLQLAEIGRLKYKPASNLDAYDLLLRAQQCEYEFRRDSHAAAIRHLKRALVIDSSYAPAMALAALCHAECRDQGWMQNPEGEASEALRLASRAVELENDNANVFWMAGYAVLRFQMDQPRARELVRHSIALNPNSAVASALAGEMEANCGNTQEALQLLSRAARLSPRDPRGWLITSKMAWAYFVDGQFDKATSACKKVLNQNPYSGYALRFLAASLASQGKMTDAALVAQDAIGIEPNLNLEKLRARLMFIEENIWQNYAGALRLAGFPE